MTDWRARRRAQAEGSLAAARLWARRKFDPNYPIDIFSIIEEEHVWLMFQPLKDVYGFYLKETVDDQEIAGIVIHNGHPLSLQRFTAAHEYGHHVLGHQSSVDLAAEVLGHAEVARQEHAAQAFAADFLMPLPMILRALRRLELPEKPEQLDSVQAYQLSLELGSSYTATVTQLVNTNRIARAHAERLQTVAPIDVKVELGAGERPQSGRSDVWQVDERSRNRLLALREGDELHVRLPEIPSGGYRWGASFSSPGPDMQLVSDGLEPLSLAQPSGRFGNTRIRHLWWRALAPGRGTIQLILRRPWEDAGAPPADAFSVELTVSARRTGALDRGASWRQRHVVAA